jgi:pimeloyl-ACP methyl ester carboxylesterase
LDPPAASVAAVYEDVSFRSTDGLLLKGWWFPVPSADRAVVIVHGRGVNRIKSSFDPQKIAQFLIASRYSVLLFDLRGHGESEGLRYSLGEYEPRDVVAAIDFAQRKAGIDRKRVAIIGESMGGGSAIMTVKADPTIGPVITDSAFADGNTVVSEVATNYTGLPEWFTPGIVLMSRVFFDLDLSVDQARGSCARSIPSARGSSSSARTTRRSSGITASSSRPRVRIPGPSSGSCRAAST